MVLYSESMKHGNNNPTADCALNNMRGTAWAFEKAGRTYLTSRWCDKFNGMKVGTILREHPKMTYQDLRSVVDNEGGHFIATEDGDLMVTSNKPRAPEADPPIRRQTCSNALTCPYGGPQAMCGKFSLC